MKAQDFDALVKAMGPKPDYSAYHKAMREMRAAADKAERYFGCPVKVAKSTVKAGNGAYVVTHTFVPAEQES